MADNRFAIESDVALPAKAQSKYPFSQMNVGDSFVVPTDAHARVSAARSAYCKRTGQQFTIQQCDDDYRCWREA